MVTDTQERNLMKLTQTESTLAAAAKAGMDEKPPANTARAGCPANDA